MSILNKLRDKLKNFYQLITTPYTLTPYRDYFSKYIDVSWIKGKLKECDNLLDSLILIKLIFISIKLGILSKTVIDLTLFLDPYFPELYTLTVNCYT